MRYIDTLKQMHACQPAIDWLRASGFDTLQAAWDACVNGSYMLWLIGKTANRDDDAQLRRLTLAKARSAKLVIHLMLDPRSVNAVNVSEAFGLGKATRQELADAADAADAYAAYAAAAYAAYAAADAYSAAAANAYAAYAAADAAYAAAAYAAAANAANAAYAANAAAAAYAAADDDDDAAINSTLAQCANIVRELYPLAPELPEV